MIYIVIGTIIIVGFLIGVTTLSVIFLAKKVTGELKARSVELLSPYDLTLEEKAKQLEEKKNELEKISKENDSNNVTDNKVVTNQKSEIPNLNSNILNVVQKIGVAQYRSNEIFSLYRKIKNTFVTSDENIEKALEMLQKEESKSSIATDLLKELEYETIYNLSTLPSDKQLEILKGSLNASGNKLLTDYLMNSKKFSVLDFYDYIKQLSEKENLKPVLYVSRYDINKKFTSKVDVEIDDSICEGFIIKYGNIVYDYSIKENGVV